MKNIEAWQGDTIPLQASKPDDTAISITLLIGDTGSPAIFSKTVNFDGESADLTITDEENIEANIPVGEHEYMLNVEYSDGSELTFPNSETEDCEGDVSLPKFVIKSRIENAS